MFQENDLPAREKRLASELAYGVCRRLITLDYLLEQYSSRPLKQIEPTILQILRVGLYQMLFQDAAADYAAVDQAVRQAQSIGRSGVDGFINAILRAVQRDVRVLDIDADPPMPRRQLLRDAGHLLEFQKDVFPDPGKQDVKYYSIQYGLPRWLTERWLKQFSSEQLRQVGLAINSRPPLTIRCNSLRTTPEELQKRLEETGHHARRQGELLVLPDSASPQTLPGFAEGHFIVQDQAAGTVAPLLEPQAGQTILDLCAAPGGKTTHLAQIMNNSGCIVACDINEERLSLVHDNCRRLGITSVQTCLIEELTQKWKSGQFDAILVDAPCSNTGVLARRVEARHLLTPADLRQRRRTQLELLEMAGRMVRPEGTVLYSTCSIDNQENEGLVETFLADHPEFTCQMTRLILPHPSEATVNQVSPSDDTPEKWTDGGFVAKLVRQPVPRSG